jgi:hypothetical protein
MPVRCHAKSLSEVATIINFTQKINPLQYISSTVRAAGEKVSAGWSRGSSLMNGLID